MDRTILLFSNRKDRPRNVKLQSDLLSARNAVLRAKKSNVTFVLEIFNATCAVFHSFIFENVIYCCFDSLFLYVI